MRLGAAVSLLKPRRAGLRLARLALLALLGLALLLGAGVALRLVWPGPGEKSLGTGADTGIGAGLPRLQALLAPNASGRTGDVADAERPVRVLFYGQSITRQNWWPGVARHLQERYPHRRFEFSNLAIGGHDASRLVRLVAADVLPLQPDLVIFHAYGPPADLRRTLEHIRAGTVAEVLMSTDHLVADDELDEETRPLWLVESGLLRRWGQRLGLLSEASTWQAWRNHEELPRVATDLGIAVADVREAWRRELRASGTSATELLADSIHLNARGEALMQRLMIEAIDRQLAVRRTHSAAAAKVDEPLRHELQLGPDCLQPLKISGYRLDAAATPTAGGVAVGLQVDGERAPRWPQLMQATRPSVLPGTEFPGLLQVGLLSQAPGSATAGSYRVRVGPRDAQGGHALSLARDGDAATVTGHTSADVVWEAAGLRLQARDWNLAYAQSAYPKLDFTGSDIRFELTPTPDPVTLRPDGPVTLLRWPVNGPRSVCLRTDGPVIALQVIEYRAPLAP